MDEKNLTDLEKMNAERKKAEAAYLDSQQDLLEVRRIIREGIAGVEDLLLYLNFSTEDAMRMEDLARQQNNSIVYSEAIGIRREFIKLFKLVIKGTEQPAEEMDGTEESHRANNKGDEGYQ